MRSADTEGEEDGEEEDGEISTDLKSKNPCVLDHCFSELPKVNFQKGLDSSQSLNRTSSNTPSHASWSASSTWSFSSSSMAAATWGLERSTSSCSLLRILPWGRDSSIRRIKVDTKTADGGVKVGKTRMQGNVVIKNWRGKPCIGVEHALWA